MISRELIHIDQNESNTNLITHITDEYDAFATIKHGILQFMPKFISETEKGCHLLSSTEKMVVVSIAIPLLQVEVIQISKLKN